MIFFQEFICLKLYVFTREVIPLIFYFYLYLRTLKNENLINGKNNELALTLCTTDTRDFLKINLKNNCSESQL